MHHFERPLTSPALPPQGGAMPLDKVRIRFRKSGDLRLVSHLDLMRSLERLLRRARLPFRRTEGFHPTPRLVLAQSLPLGVVGHAEVLELELTEPAEPDEVLRRLREQAPPGIESLTPTPKLEPHTRPVNRVVPGPRLAPPRETWGATANGPILE